MNGGIWRDVVHLHGVLRQRSPIRHRERGTGTGSHVFHLLGNGGRAAVTEEGGLARPEVEGHLEVKDVVDDVLEQLYFRHLLVRRNRWNELHEASETGLHLLLSVLQAMLDDAIVSAAAAVQGAATPESRTYRSSCLHRCPRFVLKLLLLKRCVLFDQRDLVLTKQETVGLISCSRGHALQTR